MLLSLAVFLLPCQGCVFTWLACTAGCRVEGPAATKDGHAAILEAYVSRDGARLALRYRTLVLDRYPGCPFLAMGHPGPDGFPGDPEEAWAHVDTDAIRRIGPPRPAARAPGEALPPGGEIAGVLPADCVSRRCRWRLEGMLRMRMAGGGSDYGSSIRSGPSLRISTVPRRSWNHGHAADLVSAGVRVRWNRAGVDSGEDEEVVFDLPSREYREPAGYAALLLLPVSVPVDAVCWIPTLVVFAAVR